MRALTLKPHWAHALAHLGKRCENRSRPIPKALVGQRVAIHAGASLPRGWADALRDACPVDLSVYDEFAEVAPEVRRTFHPEEPFRAVMHRAIIATAVLAECIESDGEPVTTNTPAWLRGWTDEEAAYWWRLEDVQTLVDPFLWHRGQLGLWRLPKWAAGNIEAAPTVPAGL